MNLRFPDTSAQEIYDELHRTGVLSEEFRSRLITLLMHAMSQAYERGEQKQKKK